MILEILNQLERHGWGERDRFGVHLSLEEAVVNAIRHGNGGDERKHVRVACRLSPQRLWLEVSDEGLGFRPERMPDPTAPENLEREGGRGLLLMRAYMNEVQYNAAGNQVVMEKVRSV